MGSFLVADSSCPRMTTIHRQTSREADHSMPLKFTQKRESDVPSPAQNGRINPELELMKVELSRLKPGMVLEIDAGRDRTVRSTKVLVTKAAKQLGQPMMHWSDGNKVFAKAAEPALRRRVGRPRRSAS